MAFPIATRQLWWKEWRQISPLILLLILLAVVLHLAFLASPRSLSQGGSLAVLLGLPGLFAVGAGAMLVGQEKELKTLHWLSTIPIPPKQIAATKITISTLALIVLWPISIVLAVLFGISNGVFNNFSASDFSMITWPLHSLFLLFAGFALSWRLQSSLVALILLIPIALAPSLLANLLTHLFAPSSTTTWIDLQPEGNLLAGCQVVLSAAALWLSLRHAHTALGPARPPKISQLIASRKPDTLVLGSPASPWNALLWQMVRQNKPLLLWVMLPCIAGLLFAYLTPSTTKWGANQIEPGLIAMITLVPACIFGISVFQGDQLNIRIRFLADRGVPPSRIWLSRHALFVACLVFLGLLAFAAFINSQSRSNETMQEAILASLWLFGAALLLYGVSQWVSQISTSPIVAALAAIALCIAALVYTGICVETLGCPVLLLAPLAFLPFVATRISTRAWMDRKRGWKYWVTQGVCLAIMLLAPSIPMLITWSTTPQISPEMRSKFAEMAANAPATSFSREIVVSDEPIFEDTFPDDNEFSPNDAAAPPVSLSADDRIENTMLRLQSQLRAFQGPIKVNSSLVEYLSGDLQQTRLNLIANSETNATFSHYNDLVRMSIDLVLRLRQSDRIQDQDTADLIEMQLLDELKLAPATPLMAPEVDAQARQLLANYEVRREARKRSIAWSWKVFTRNKSSIQPDIGGYSIYHVRYQGPLAQLIYRWEAERMLEQLWKLAELEPAQDATKIHANLTSFWLGTGAQYGTEDAWSFGSGIPQAMDRNNQLPGRYWNHAWEKDARNLDVKAPVQAAE